MPTRTFPANLGLTTRVTRSSGATAGAGDYTRLLVGRTSLYDYMSFLRFTLDFSEVGLITAAVLYVYTDNGAVLPLASASDTPKAYARRVRSAWNEGTGNDSFVSADYDNPTTYAHTGSPYGKDMAKAEDAITGIDVLTFVRAWQNGATNYGIRLHGTSDATDAWSGWSEDGGAATDPFIEITYEYGVTVPETPTNLVPTGDVTSIDLFESDYADINSADKLAWSYLEVWNPTAAGTASAATNIITSTAHGMAVGTRLFFRSLTGGTGLSTTIEYYVRTVTANGFKVATTNSDSTIIDITVNYSALTWTRRLFEDGRAATTTEADANHSAFALTPANYALIIPNRTYMWRARHKDTEAQVSPWSTLTTFTLTNVVPNDPTLEAIPDQASLDGVHFRGTATDPDVGDIIAFFQVQLTAYPEGSPEWDDADYILWDTGSRATADPGGFDTFYGGQALDTDTYYWRARVFDQVGGVSGWTYSSFDLTADFDVEPQSTEIQLRPRTPWRVVIREMKFNAIGGAITGSEATNVLTSASPHGMAVNRRVRFSALNGGLGLYVGQDYYVETVPSTTTFTLAATLGGATLDFTTNIIATSTLTAITTRGPGNVVAILEDVKSPGGSKMYNSPGEGHWTMPKDHPQLSVVEPKQTHYAIEFYAGDGWREVYAGLTWDIDAADTDIVFYGLDYLALLDFIYDERYDAARPELPAEKGGSYYVTSGKNSTGYIIHSQLTRARTLANSPVGFIGMGQSEATLISLFPKTQAIYSTMQPCLSFVSGLIESHRAGSTPNPRSRISVKKTAAGAYQFWIEESPGVARDNMRLQYGELVQGYRVIPFGKEWGTRTHTIGRTIDGVKPIYKTAVAPGIDETVWGRFAQVALVDGVNDEHDLDRRTRQLAIRQGVLGRQLGVGIRTGWLQPFDGYDIPDLFPVSIVDGSINTAALSGHAGTPDDPAYWVCYGVTWEGGEQGQQSVTLTLLPEETGDTPSSDILTLQPISTQAEWQIGWDPPDPVKASSLYWLDQSTGKVYRRDLLTGASFDITGDP